MENHDLLTCWLAPQVKITRLVSIKWILWQDATHGKIILHGTNLESMAVGCGLGTNTFSLLQYEWTTKRSCGSPHFSEWLGHLWRLSWQRSPWKLRYYLRRPQVQNHPRYADATQYTLPCIPRRRGGRPLCDRGQEWCHQPAGLHLPRCRLEGSGEHSNGKEKWV